MMSMQAMLEHIADEVENAEFKHFEKQGIPGHPGSLSLKCETSTGVYLVVSFDIEDQGFPPGSKGYDGTYVHLGKTIVHLTRELAEKVYRKMESCLNKS